MTPRLRAESEGVIVIMDNVIAHWPLRLILKINQYKFADEAQTYEIIFFHLKKITLRPMGGGPRPGCPPGSATALNRRIVGWSNRRTV